MSPLVGVVLALAVGGVAYVALTSGGSSGGGSGSTGGLDALSGGNTKPTRADKAARGLGIASTLLKAGGEIASGWQE